MSKISRSSASNQKHLPGSLASYCIGFVLSLIFTVWAYVLVAHHSLTAPALTAIVVTFALLQFIVQLIFFLHLGIERRPRWKLLVLVFMICVVSILVFGSLWIMNNLNYRMTPQQINNYLNNQGGGF